ncbi:MAG: WD40-repeat-containing domain protein [Benjaminiella poitrasii]|nr:MAG: WD40-repeat-containing domain protein [Benjaminiella poitrasii]
MTGHIKFSYSNLYKHSRFQCKISPNDHYVANVVENRLVIRAHGQELTVVQVNEARLPIDYILWSPTSDYILTINYAKSRIDIRSVIDPKWHGVITDERYPFVKVQWSSDSKNVLCISELKLRLAIWNLSTKEMKYINHLKYSEKGIEFSPDKNYVAIVEKYKEKDCIGIYHGNSFILLHRFEVNTVDLDDIKWCPDSMYIAIWDNCLYHKLLIYRYDGYLCATYTGYEFGLGIKCVNWSPNGKLLALGNYDQTIHLLSTLSWQLVGTLEHPTTLTETMETNVMEEIELPPPVIPTFQKANIDYRHVLKRPFHIPTRRTGYEESNPKTGIGICQFSPDGLYLYSKSVIMPNIIWIWQIKSLKCLHIILFRKTIKQANWNPCQNHLLTVTCGDEHIHLIQPTEGNDDIDISSHKVPTTDFLVKKIKWNSNGNALLLMDQDLFCIAVQK